MNTNCPSSMCAWVKLRILLFGEDLRAKWPLFGGEMEYRSSAGEESLSSAQRSFTVISVTEPTQTLKERRKKGNTRKNWLRLFEVVKMYSFEMKWLMWHEVVLFKHHLEHERLKTDLKPCPAGTGIWRNWDKKLYSLGESECLQRYYVWLIPVLPE